MRIPIRILGIIITPHSDDDNRRLVGKRGMIIAYLFMC